MEKRNSINSSGTSIHISRDIHGVPHINATSESAMYRGLGFVHGKDRGLQMLLTRLIGQGKLCEHLQADDESLAIDQFFRKMNWKGENEKQVLLLNEKEKRLAQSYADGVNHALSEGLPFEFKLFNYRPGPWKIEDTILFSRMIGYISLTDSIYKVKKILLEFIKKDIPFRQLKELFPGITEDDFELVKKVSLQENIIPETFWGKGMPSFTASNNWVVSGKRTASGSPLHASDPHLELRLPSVWQEVSMQYNEIYTIGASMPGVPGVLIGRNNNVSWSATYTYMDSVDFWIEDCKDGMYRTTKNNSRNTNVNRSNTYKRFEWKKFTERKEIIHRKGKTPVTITFYENERGVLEGNPYQDDFFLSFNWTGRETGGKSLKQILKLPYIKDVKDGMNTLGAMETAWNWLFADVKGNIGYQMSGLMPIRNKKNILPLPGWEKTSGWQGFVPYNKLPSSYNPKSGYIITANNNLNHLGKAKPITYCMASYRADRIAKLLNKKGTLSIETMKEIQFDLYSNQAEIFMKLLRPLIPGTENGKILKEWDMRYTIDSKGAFFFDRFYNLLLKEIFHLNGYNTLGEFIFRETELMNDFYLNFDNLLWQKTSTWFGGLKRDDVFRKVLDEALNAIPENYGKQHSISIKHMLFGGKLPKFMGYDTDQLEMPGSKGTIFQGQIFKTSGRETSFLPSFRMITDMAGDIIFTNLPGGPSDRRFSKWYTTDLKNWQEGVYKKLTPNPETRLSFPS